MPAVFGAKGAPVAGDRYSRAVGAPSRVRLAGLVLLLAACARTAPPAVQAPAVTSVHLALGLPTDGDPGDELVLDHGTFVLSYDPRRRVANWVSWRLEAADLGPAPRQDDFHPDELLPAALLRVRPLDYRGSGFDRGHLCPSGDRTSTAEANSSTFVMTNMQPQVHALNAGPWEGLEVWERRQASRGEQLYIVAGGLFDAEVPTIGPGIAVPRASYKILVALRPGQGPGSVTVDTPVYAVVMPNVSTVRGTRWQQYLVTVDDVERASGYDFLSAIPTAIGAILEARLPAAP
jgi:endonuclease G